MAKDPICGMEVDTASAIKVTKGSEDYFFCSSRCKDKFVQQQGASAIKVCLPASRRPLLKNKLFITSAFLILILLASLFVGFLKPLGEALLMYIGKIWWAVALGLLLGGVIDHYIPAEYISKILSRKKPATIFNSVLLGFLMSACSHGILALSIQLHKKGASNPAVVSFLLASPWANFAVTMMLLSLFGLKGLFIIIAAIVIAINTGFIFMFLEKKGLIETNKNTVETSGDFSIMKDIKARQKAYKFSPAALAADFKGIIKGAVALSDMVLWWIILGLLFASIAGTYIPVHFFHRFMGPTMLGLLVTLAVATIIEICSEGSSPLSFEIYRQSGALGNSFVFLMAGVATDYTEIGLLWVNVGRRVALWLPLVTVPQVVVLGYIFNNFIK
jgi:uncharacterized membrane protein YraQ (UPF0718 family)/YHS domain-containing protein